MIFNQSSQDHSMGKDSQSLQQVEEELDIHMQEDEVKPSPKTTNQNRNKLRILT